MAWRRQTSDIRPKLGQNAAMTVSRQKDGDAHGDGSACMHSGQRKPCLESPKASQWNPVGHQTSP